MNLGRYAFAGFDRQSPRVGAAIEPVRFLVLVAEELLTEELLTEAHEEKPASHPFAVALSRQAKSIIRQNLWISLGVIAILVPSTLFGFARLGVAVVFHEGSTLIVVANALRLLRFRVK